MKLAKILKIPTYYSGIGKAISKGSKVWGGIVTDLQFEGEFVILTVSYKTKSPKQFKVY